jgi:hypothetical protein
MNAVRPGEAHIRSAFAAAGLSIVELEVKDYPEETVYVVHVLQEAFSEAVELGNGLDEELSSPERHAFVVIRKADKAGHQAIRRQAVRDGVHDTRATELSSLIVSRSRASLAQPSLAYVGDMKRRVAAVTAPRHCLVFGRRGAGKTALMVEARKIVAQEGAAVVWMNLQTYSGQNAGLGFLYFAREISTYIVSDSNSRVRESRVAVDASALLDKIDGLINAPHDPDQQTLVRLIPDVQRILQRYLQLTARRMYVFLDDFYFVPRGQQPQLLDLVHSSTRDCDVWLKIATIKHLTRWFQLDPPLGLQIGHDADSIEIDVPLQNPAAAEDFLENILQTYAREVGIHSLTSVLRQQALDRLVIASGAVPRDYLTLAAHAITRAQRRQNARLVGAQDINEEAGERAKSLLRELQEDLAADKATATLAIRALQAVKDFCLEQGFGYFKVDHRDKEHNAGGYDALVSLMDVRLVHLIDPSVSAAHQAGEMSEVFMLDLSQYAGSRLKRNMRVLDLVRGVFVARQTGAGGALPQPGRTPRAVTTILRAGPVLELSILTPD